MMAELAAASLRVEETLLDDDLFKGWAIRKG